jgi:hypothetical protein
VIAQASLPSWHPSPKARATLGLTRLRLRGLTGADDEFLLAAIVQNLKRLAKALRPTVPGMAGACFAQHSSLRQSSPPPWREGIAAQRLTTTADRSGNPHP